MPQDQVAANRNWTFQINGKRVFAHGANWLPCDMRTSECTPEHYEYLIGSAADANMNFIRVWGVSNPAFFFFIWGPASATLLRRDNQLRRATVAPRVVLVRLRRAPFRC